jgi:hypothetical protein
MSESIIRDHEISMAKSNLSTLRKTNPNNIKTFNNKIINSDYKHRKGRFNTLKRCPYKFSTSPSTFGHKKIAKDGFEPPTLRV